MGDWWRPMIKSSRRRMADGANGNGIPPFWPPGASGPPAGGDPAVRGHGVRQARRGADCRRAAGDPAEHRRTRLHGPGAGPRAPRPDRARGADRLYAGTGDLAIARGAGGALSRPLRRRRRPVADRHHGRRIGRADARLPDLDRPRRRGPAHRSKLPVQPAFHRRRRRPAGQRPRGTGLPLPDDRGGADRAMGPEGPRHAARDTRQSDRYVDSVRRTGSDRLGCP